MQLNPYLTFNGDCEQAFKFYAEVLGGKIEMMRDHADSPMADQVPAEWREKIIHARMTIGGKMLMGSDAPPDRYEKAQGFSVSQRCHPAGRCSFRFRKPSGPRLSASWSIGSASHGWSAPRKLLDPD